MKSIKSLASAALLLAVSMGFTSCSDDDDKAFVVSFNDPSITMDSKTSAWADVMNENSGQLYYSGFSFSHSVTVTEWGGTKYYSWGGFCPSMSSLIILITGKNIPSSRFNSVSAACNFPALRI